MLGSPPPWVQILQLITITILKCSYSQPGIIILLGYYGFGLGESRADLASSSTPAIDFSSLHLFFVPNSIQPTKNTNPEPSHQSLQLTAEEALINDFDNVLIHPETQPDSFCLVVKILTPKTPKPNWIGNSMKDAWVARFPFTFTEYHSGLYLVRFGCEGDRRRVMEGQPWHFDRSLMLFAIPDGFDTILPNQLRYIPLWLQAHFIPFGNRSHGLAHFIVDTIGDLIEVHLASLYDSIIPFMRIRVLLDTTKPLFRGMNIHFWKLSLTKWSKFQYEGIQNYCYHCGKLDHTFNRCENFLHYCDTHAHSPPLSYKDVLRAPAKPIYKKSIFELSNSTPFEEIPSLSNVTSQSFSTPVTISDQLTHSTPQPVSHFPSITCPINTAPVMTTATFTSTSKGKAPMYPEPPWVSSEPPAPICPKAQVAPLNISAIHRNPSLSTEDIAKVNQLQSHVNSLLLREEFLWKQRSRVNWLKGISQRINPDHFTFLNKDFDSFEAALDVLNKGADLWSINETYLVLIPKKSNASKVCDFRPISLCSTFYKVIAKTIANCLKTVLTSLISHNQGAFLSNRIIFDNILIANEVINAINGRKAGKGISNLIIPSRGIRQGDPLSPYLFLLVVEGLSVIIPSKEHLALFKDISICRSSPSISHMLFADDSLLFTQVSHHNSSYIQDILSTYNKAMGQFVNLAKSSVLFSRNTSHHDKHYFLSSLGMADKPFIDTYLGVPQCFARSKKSSFHFILQRASSKLSVWKSKLFSKAGKEVLLKAVIQAILSYVMSCYRVPQSICKQLEKLMANFWWGAKGQNKSKIHWKSWHNLCKSKFFGGLGFRSIINHNQAMLAKQACVFFKIPLPFLLLFSKLSISNIMTFSKPQLVTVLLFPGEVYFGVKIFFLKGWFGTLGIGHWDIHKLNTYFDVDLVASILSTPITSSSQDCLIWGYDPSGNLTEVSFKPAVGFYKLSVDAASQRQTNKQSFGAVVQDHTGRIMAALHSSTFSCTQPIFAEAEALYRAITWCAAVRFPIGLIVSDCQLLIGKIINQQRNNSALSDKVWQIISSLSLFPDASIRYMPRSLNT
uniref:Reverse transcriptase domain-containing protein n=1 Tax=Cannabis sativa TaxID=3483 RepID=A0A803NLJ9_CANSA